MTTQVVLASTGFGLATVVAALEDGCWAAVDRRVLVLSNNATLPEATPGVAEVAGMAGLLDRFDAVHSWNAEIAPQHPSLWRPQAQDLPLIERFLTHAWGLEDDLQLIVESIQVNPALALCSIFADAAIQVYGDGLMSYGPTRNRLPASVACRLERLLHLDLVPGLRPVLLTEFGVPSEVVSWESFRKVIAPMEPTTPAIAAAAAHSVAVLLGQYLAPLGLLSADQERRLHGRMVAGAVAAGFDRLVFKPHPSAPAGLTAPLVTEAARLGAVLEVHDTPELVEPWFQTGSVGLVVGCFSTALATASAGYDLPVRRVGTRMLLRKLGPYENSNRIPLILTHAQVPAAPADGSKPADPSPAVPLADLVALVSYCMQPGRYPSLRPVAERLLTEQARSLRAYVPEGRLSDLDLPGRPPVRRPDGALTGTVKRLLGPRLSRSVARRRRQLGGWRRPGGGGRTGSTG